MSLETMGGSWESCWLLPLPAISVCEQMWMHKFGPCARFTVTLYPSFFSINSTPFLSENLSGVSTIMLVNMTQGFS